MFFFSSRRRHTRSLRDWSSDVCSSDLDHPHPAVLEAVDADVARVFATAARGMAESAEQRRALVLAIPALERSEERRVGKECSSGVMPDLLKSQQEKRYQHQTETHSVAL